MAMARWWERRLGEWARPRGRRLVWIVVAVVVGIAVVGGSAVLLSERNSFSVAGEVAVAPASPAGGGGYSTSGSADESTRSSAGSDAGVAVDAPAAPQLAPDQIPGVPVGGVGRELIRSAQLTLEVEDPVASIRQVRTAAAAASALIVEESSSSTGAWLTLRVPAEALDRLVDDVAGHGKVLERSGQVVDATEEVVDLDARVRSQQASVDRIRGLLAQAQSIGDIVAIEAELASREAELDSLTARLAALRDQVALSTLSISLQTPSTPVPVPTPGPAGFLDGLAAGWAGLLAVGTAVAAVFGFVLPLLPVVAVVFGIAWLVRRVLRGRRRPAPAPAASGTGDGGA
jgi:hypothetical protein